MDGSIAVIFDESRTKVLILQRTDVDIWVLPGGGIEKEETPEQAVIREVREEVGLSVEIVRKVGEYTPLIRLASMTHVFECRSLGGQLTLSSESRAIAYAPIDQLPKLFFPVHEDFLKDALRNEPHVIKKPLERITYREILKYLIQHPFKVMRFAISQFIGL